MDHIPICRGRSDLRAVVLLEVPGAAEMIGVTVTQQHVLHVRRIQTELLQPGDHDGLDPIRVAGVDEDDALRRGDGIDRRFGVADGVDVVEQPHGLQFRASALFPLALPGTQ